MESDVGTDVEVALKRAGDALADVTDADLALIPVGALEHLVAQVQRVRNQADAACTRLTGAFDTSRVWSECGARSAAAWITAHCRLDKDTAKTEVRNARRLRSMPDTAAAFERGDITAHHVAQLGRAQHKNPDAFADSGEQLLLEVATSQHPASFDKVITYWRHINAPDDAERDARSTYEAREAYAARTFGGTVEIRASLDPITGTKVHTELQRRERQLFEEDWAEARHRKGDQATASDLARTTPQRMADALGAMAEASAAMPEGARKPRPLITVLIDKPTLLGRVCELSDGTILTPGEVLPLLVDFDLERIIFDGASRVLDVGVRQRCFTGATRRAVEVRDLQCSHDTCTEPAEHCQVDHIIDYDHGGPTVQDNGDLKCPHHHRWRHQRGRPPPAD
jgi:hypothetical protein